MCTIYLGSGMHTVLPVGTGFPPLLLRSAVKKLTVCAGAYYTVYNVPTSRLLRMLLHAGSALTQFQLQRMHGSWLLAWLYM